MLILVKSMPLLWRANTTPTPGAWRTEANGIDLHNSISEHVADDSRFIHQILGGGAGSCQVNLGGLPTIPVVPGARHTFVFRALFQTLGGSYTFAWDLLSGGTPVKNVVGLQLTPEFQTYSYELTPAEAAMIGTYNSLQMFFHGAGIGLGEHSVSWAQFRRY